MFEQLLKEYLIKLLTEDEQINDIIRKQATLDIWEAIEDDVDSAIDKAIDELTICRG